MLRQRSELLRWRRLLRPLSTVYGGALRLRNWRYDARPGAVQSAGVPVISIGNITTGGTGKTPLVIEVVRLLLARGRKPAILTRGYGAARRQTADEVEEFQAALPETPVVVDADRVVGAAVAVGEKDADVLVLDDGFQHRRLARNLDVVVIDALRPWGGGDVLPAGNLREPLTSLARGDLFVISRANQVGAAAREAIEAELRDWVTDPRVVHAAVHAAEVVWRDGRRSPPDELRPMRLQPVCGIGNPQTFARLLAPLASAVRTVLPFPDHHRYTAEDARVIVEAARRRGVDVIVTTRKDWGKLVRVWPADSPIPLARIDVRMMLDDAAGQFTAALDAALGGES